MHAYLYYIIVKVLYRPVHEVHNAYNTEYNNYSNLKESKAMNVLTSIIVQINECKTRVELLKGMKGTYLENIQYHFDK